MYGAAGPKIGKMLGTTKDIGKFIVEAFWDGNSGLKTARDTAIEYWKAAGRNKYVLTIDGRVVSIRRQHSVLNSVFQSTGAVIMDYAGWWTREQALREGLEWQAWGYFHDEYQAYDQKKNVEKIEMPLDIVGEGVYDEKKGKMIYPKPPMIHDGRIWTKPKEINGKWVQYYSRIGELGVLGIRAAGRHFNLGHHVDSKYIVDNTKVAPEDLMGDDCYLDSDYMIGENWGDCH